MSSQTKQAPELNRADTGAMADAALSSTLDSSGIPHPALVVNGSNDIVVPTVYSYILRQTLPNAELILFPDSTHGSQFQFTELFNRYVTDFVDR
jgi:pimeloyl-ACP methyl ester carboxylesterase